MAMLRDLTAVSESFSKFLKLLDALGMVAVIFVLQLVKPLIHGETVSPLGALSTTVGFPLLLVPIFICRNKRGQEVVENAAHGQNNLVEHIEYTVDVFPLVADYSKRAAFVSIFDNFIREFNRANKELNLVLLTNIWIAPWVVSSAKFAYMAFGGLLVITGRTSLGSFLANVSILDKVGECWSNIFSDVVNLQGVFSSLEKTVIFLNLSTDLKQRGALYDATAKYQTDFRHSHLLGSEAVSVDNIPIKFHCGEKPSPLPKGLHPRDFWDGDAEIDQGTLVAIIGPRGGGKSTVLRMLGGAQLPQLESNLRCLVPSHLRVLHVSADPLLIAGTLWDNLTFGVVPGDPDGERERVLRICERLNMSKHILDWMDSSEAWHKKLSMTEIRQIHLARGLIANYHVMCVHRPTMGCSKKASQRIMSLLEEFVRKRGVEQDEGMTQTRRPRTCIFTGTTHEGLLEDHHVDRVFMVKHNRVERWESAEVFSVPTGQPGHIGQHAKTRALEAELE